MTTETKRMRQYGISNHAIKRAVERLGVLEEHARNYLTQLMQTAYFQGYDGRGRIFDHYEKRTRIILATDKDVIVAVYSMDTDKDGNLITYATTPELPGNNSIINAARDTIKRELTKARRIFTREYRQLSLSIADLNIEIAEAVRNQIRCLHPPTQDIIQRNIDEMKARVKKLDEQLAGKKSNYERMKNEARAFIGTEVES